MTSYLILLVLISGGVTVLLRAFPFLAFGRGGKPPELVIRLGDRIPPAAIAMLVVYCFCGYFQDKTFAECGYGIPELAAAAAVIGLHLLAKNPLLSILTGTVIYMILIQNVF